MVEKTVIQIIPEDCPCGYNDCSACRYCTGNVEDGIVQCYYDEEAADEYGEDYI